MELPQNKINYIRDEISDFPSRHNMNYPSNNNSRYKFLIKEIAKKLKKRVKLPKCKIFKFHNRYRELILRISNGIKETSKKLNFWEKWEHKNESNNMNKIQKIDTSSFQILKQGNSNTRRKKVSLKISKINMSLIKKSYENKKQSNNEKNILFLNNLEVSNTNFINKFSSFLKNNGIEIGLYNKLPTFKNKDNEYLNFEYEFWIKYINYICMEYKKSLTIDNLVNFIEQFYFWIDKNKNNNINYENFNKEIINKINQIFDSNTINNFLQKHKIKNINTLFEKYKFIYIPNYKEIKIIREPEILTYKNEINFNIISNAISNKKHEIFLKKLSESKNNIISINNDNMNMNNINNMNINMDNNINYNPHMKVIKNYSSNYENSYANAVLQAFSSLGCIRNWIKKLNYISNLLKNIQSSITKELYILFSNLYRGDQVDSTNLISTLENQVREIYNKEIIKDDYHFLKYFLKMLHLENNCPNNPEFNINSYNNQTIENIKNDNRMYNSFCKFFQQTTNSIISQYFYNIEKYFTSCSKCSQIFYYDHKVIITFDIYLLIVTLYHNISKKIK